MRNEFRFRKAQIIGRSHALAGINCQDALNLGVITIDSEPVIYGVICDGCSEGHDSEVGAKLAVSYIGRQIEILVKSRVPMSKIPDILHKRILKFFGELLGRITFDSPTSRVQYIKNNFLFTTLGFILYKNQLMTFVQGDGVIIVNDSVDIRDENDTPMYIGYGLVERRFLTGSATTLPTGFETRIYDAGTIDRFVIASDSLGNEILKVMPKIWGNEKPISLQRKVNAWSWNDHLFGDDLSIILMERPEGG